jgi:uncharacterized RDD family membrane protein YckC
MTMTMDDYIKQVADRMPSGNPLRAQIALELKATIGERLARGQSMDEVLRQLGDPASFADAYLSAEPLEAAAFSSRAIAKIADFVIVTSVLAMAFLVVRSRQSGPQGDPGVGVPELILIFLLVVSPLYTVLSEYYAGKTIGKWLMGLRVVRESGARIGFGQAFVRQLALVFQVFVFDCLFALFTEKRQRACELLSKTRVVRAERAGAQVTDHHRIAGGDVTTPGKTLLILFAVAGTLLAVLIVLLLYFRATFEP